MRLEAPNGTGEVSLDLSLPLRDRASYDLSASLGIIDGELVFRGFAPRATEIEGALALNGGALSGEGIKAIFLDGPVTARVDSPNVPGYRAQIALEGEVTIDAVVDAFDLPFGEYLAGQTRWEGRLLIPAAEVDEPRAAAHHRRLEPLGRCAAVARAVREGAERADQSRGGAHVCG